MTSAGEIRTWDADEGWGVIDSPDTPGGCWVHFSAWLSDDWNPAPGTPVELAFEAARQDGFEFRALEAWPQGSTPRRREPTADPSAYSSFGWITFTEADGEPK